MSFYSVSIFRLKTKIKMAKKTVFFYLLHIYSFLISVSLVIQNIISFEMMINTEIGIK